METNKEFNEFASTRLGGAEKITDNAKEKGGAAMLTYHHFEVKLPYYKKASEGKFDIDEAKTEYKDLLEKLYSATKGDMDIEQIDFQELVGKIEVLGELIIKDTKELKEGYAEDDHGMGDEPGEEPIDETKIQKEINEMRRINKRMLDY